MTVAEHRERVGKEFQQAQEQAQRFGQQATQWAQRVLYLQGQLDLLQQLDPESPIKAPREQARNGVSAQNAIESATLSRAERRRAAKANGAADSAGER